MRIRRLEVLSCIAISFRASSMDWLPKIERWEEIVLVFALHIAAELIAS